jgi:hypothetical protein
VQRVVAGEIDLDVTDGVPVALIDVFLDQLGQRFGELRLPGP